jgi:hypothetical protein
MVSMLLPYLGPAALALASIGVMGYSTRSGIRSKKPDAVGIESDISGAR